MKFVLFFFTYFQLIFIKLHVIEIYTHYESAKYEYWKYLCRDIIGICKFGIIKNDD